MLKKGTEMNDISTRYNYDAFTNEKALPWLRFDQSPALGKAAPDFPLWQLENKAETSLSAVLSSSTYTVVEFGSFT